MGRRAAPAPAPQPGGSGNPPPPLQRPRAFDAARQLRECATPQLLLDVWAALEAASSSAPPGSVDAASRGGAYLTVAERLRSFLGGAGAAQWARGEHVPGVLRFCDAAAARLGAPGDGSFDAGQVIRLGRLLAPLALAPPPTLDSRAVAALRAVVAATVARTCAGMDALPDWCVSNAGRLLVDAASLPGCAPPGARAALRDRLLALTPGLPAHHVRHVFGTLSLMRAHSSDTVLALTRALLDGTRTLPRDLRPSAAAGRAVAAGGGNAGALPAALAVSPWALLEHASTVFDYVRGPKLFRAGEYLRDADGGSADLLAAERQARHAAAPPPPLSALASVAPAAGSDVDANSSDSDADGGRYDSSSGSGSSSGEEDGDDLLARPAARSTPTAAAAAVRARIKPSPRDVLKVRASLRTAAYRLLDLALRRSNVLIMADAARWKTPAGAAQQKLSGASRGGSLTPAAALRELGEAGVSDGDFTLPVPQQVVDDGVTVRELAATLRACREATHMAGLWMPPLRLASSASGTRLNAEFALVYRLKAAAAATQRAGERAAATVADELAALGLGLEDGTDDALAALADGAAAGDALAGGLAVGPDGERADPLQAIANAALHGGVPSQRLCAALAAALTARMAASSPARAGGFTTLTTPRVGALVDVAHFLACGGFHRAPLLGALHEQLAAAAATGSAAAAAAALFPRAGRHALAAASTAAHRFALALALAQVDASTAPPSAQLQQWPSRGQLDGWSRLLAHPVVVELAAGHLQAHVGQLALSARHGRALSLVRTAIAAVVVEEEAAASGWGAAPSALPSLSYHEQVPAEVGAAAGASAAAEAGFGAPADAPPASSSTSAATGGNACSVLASLLVPELGLAVRLLLEGDIVLSHATALPPPSQRLWHRQVARALPPERPVVATPGGDDDEDDDEAVTAIAGETAGDGAAAAAAVDEDARYAEERVHASVVVAAEGGVRVEWAARPARGGGHKAKQKQQQHAPPPAAEVRVFAATETPQAHAELRLLALAGWAVLPLSVPEVLMLPLPDVKRLVAPSVRAALAAARE